MWATFTVDRMDYISAQWFLPIGLIIDYSLFVYLLVMYWNRRREPRLILLLSVGLLSTIILVPYARADHEKVTHLNDISEFCGILTFMIQVTIVGRDLNKKVKFRNIFYATLVAEMLIGVDLVALLLSLADEFHDAVLSDTFSQDMLYILENVNLAFVFCFRLYCVVAANGWSDVVQNRRLEMFTYFLFASSDMPFILLDFISDLNWDAPMALYNRLTIAAALFVVTRAKIRKESSSANQSLHHSTVGRTSLVSVSSRRVKHGGASMAVRSATAPVSNKSTVYVAAVRAEMETVDERGRSQMD